MSQRKCAASLEQADPARGNHDGGPYFPRLFGLVERQYYSLDWGPVHVAVLDAFGPGASGEARKAQAAWLDRNLAASTAPWKVILVHDPMVNEDLINDWWGLDDVMPLVEKHRVAVVFSGHHHRYRRFLPLHPPGSPDAGGTWHITTGGSGGTLSGRLASPLAVRNELVNHFVRVDVDGDRLRMTIIDIRGDVIDEIELRRISDGAIVSDSETPVDRAVAERIVTFFTHLSPYKTPDVLLAGREGDEVVVDFDSLRSGPMDTGDYPETFRVGVEVAEGCEWDVEPRTFAIRGARELRFSARPRTDGAPPLQVTLRPTLDNRALVAHTFDVEFIDE
jgi:hypothetical protein